MTPELEKTPDQNIPETPAKNPASATQGTAVTRRQFSRGLVGGSAVLLTVANRPAWGEQTVDLVCISQNTWNSHIDNGAGFASHIDGNTQDQIIEFEKYYNNENLNEIKNGDNYCVQVSTSG